ncbi:hypothetical protein NB646_07615 [Oxalobacter aliiformigenes]|uniref:Uncharacterized protein n=1 Tax=Oxalobacter aliiformigenes TaxID=2946593 RepID=A0A9E9LCE6_9BURK|nr:hypothetical protein [Oxalobacter aliiformigenes]WAV90713.1 hypothetical protein NB646_07615 [Oxalobacter aliiformigenes]
MPTKVVPFDTTTEAFSRPISARNSPMSADITDLTGWGIARIQAFLNLIAVMKMNRRPETSASAL